MTTYTDFHARECHTTTRYEAPVCMAVVEAVPAFVRAIAPKSTAPRPNYPAYLLRTFNGVLCETL